MEPATLPRSVRFGVFEVDLRAGELRKGGLRIRLQEQPFQVLAMLLEHPGDVVTREELQRKLWSTETFVDFDHGVNTAINKIRQALGDSAENPRFVETVARRGYRFVAPVEICGAHNDAPAVPEASAPPDLVGKRREETALIERRYSRRWLAVLGGALAAAAIVFAWFAMHQPPSAHPELKVRRLTANPSDNPVTKGAISPDGKYLAYGDLKGLHLKLIQTGQTVNIPQPEGPDAPAPGRWWPNGWFPEGTKFVASGYEAGSRCSAWVISALGGLPRKLCDDAHPWAVSPDGTRILFARGDFRAIWLMGPQGEEPHKLVTASEDEFFYWTVWSPDGRRFAYSRLHGLPDKAEFSIESRDLEGGQPTVIVSDPGLDLNGAIVWLPSGLLVYPVREHTEISSWENLWGVRVDSKTGAPVSRPRRITNWVEGTLEISGRSDGKQLAVTKDSRQKDVYVAELEPGGRRLKNSARLTLEESDDFPGAWTPDSKAVLFWSNRDATWGIYIQRLDQTAAQTIVTGPDYKNWPVVSPDGSWILYLSSADPNRGPTTPVRIMRIPASGGAPQVVLEGLGVHLACAQPPATGCVFSENAPDQEQAIFTEIDPVKGKVQELTRVRLRKPGTSYLWALSPDGSRVAFLQFDPYSRLAVLQIDLYEEGRIQILPLRGGEARQVNVKGWRGLAFLFWAADGKGLYVSAAGHTALYVDLEARARVIWQEQQDATVPVFGVPSPNGRYLALLGYSGDSNVWLLENF